MEEINRSSPIPYYYQLQESLQTWIKNENFPPNAQLPSEAELCERYAVSRTVVRQALLGLEQDGVIYRVKGRGSFVAQPKLHQKIAVPTNFTKDIQDQGLRPGGHVVRQDMVDANENIAQHLQISINGSVFCLERVRTANGEPHAIETAYLHFPGCELLQHENFEDHSLYEILATRYQIAFSKADLVLEATVIHRDEAHLLGLTTGTPAMFLQRTTYDKDLTPFEYTRCVYRGDKYRFVTTLQK